MTLSTSKWKGKFKLNKVLVSSQNLLEEEVKEIESLHESRMDLEETMLREEGVEALHALAKEWTVLQFRLQIAWGFAPDEKYHRFWEVPKCRCPKIDNEEDYTTGFSIINASCPVHRLRGKEPINLYNIEGDMTNHE